ncbi:hypothetical protein BDV59DRAFT_108268 [Aspergillus ambiguus]|uniref:translation initiation factor 2 n=1 Tax=Aspergillus ambiguus TaxID=176160 RepID=UPI003CCE219F
MHRRAILELSRRHGVESYAVRPRPAAFSPVLSTHLPRRSFRTSLVTFNSSETSPDANASDAPDSRSTTKPKFGARWGSKLAQKPAALSPAEQALRDALVAKNPSESSKPISRSDSRGQNAPVRTQQKYHLPSSHPLRDKESQSLQPDKKFELSTNKVPTHLRNRDWICPDCQYHCFGKHKICPCCRAVRPDLNSPPPPPRRSHKKHEGRHHNPQHAEETIKIRKLGKTMLSEWQDDSAGSSGLSRRDNALRQHMASKGQYAGPRIVYDVEAEAEQVEAEEAEKRRRLHQHPKKGKQTEEAADPWTWDSSSLDAMKLSEETAQQKKLSKRRESRRRNEEVEEEDEEAEERRRRREERKRQKKDKARRKEVEVDTAPIPLYLPEFISVSNLADVIGVRPAQFVQRMEEMGFEDVTYNHILDAETAGLVVTEFNFEPIFETGADDLKPAPEPEDKSIFPPRPPVVTIMGHVDHGKTTILDWLRESSVAASEHGGITQHIGAFSVAMPSGKTITFLDTPGHSAFLEMRRRGADVTDIVVLVVAADDSVKPQTIEAIKHATGANVPIIVAISKVDKENVNLEKVKQDLSVHGVHVEDYGGDVQAIGVSGKTGQGMLELEEAIVTLSEILDHRADTGGSAEGWVIEGTTKSYGRVATALVRRGTLRPGDIVVAGTTWARIRTLRNEAGVAVDEATPGMPVEIDGWREQPSAGSEILQAVDEQQAKEVVEYRLEKSETQKLGQDAAAINEARREVLEKRRQEDGSEDSQTVDAAQDTSGPKPIHFIIKADVGGSAEAVLNSVTAIGNNEVFANVLRSGVGPVGEFDIEHAATANGHLISFNMPIDPAMHRMAENRGVKIMDHNIIYKLIDDVKAALSEHLAPTVSQRVTGEAEVGQIFEITLKGREKTSIAGCRVRNGVINRTKKVRVLRGQETIFDGKFPGTVIHPHRLTGTEQARCLPSRTSRKT